MPNRFITGLLGLILGLALLAPSAAYAIGEQNGRLSGRIVEQGSEAAVPGADVTISSPALPGGKRKVNTDEDGVYNFDQLPPGTYTVEVSYSGLKPLYRQVIVSQGALTPLNIAWSAELAETETTVVVQQRTLTRPDSTTQGVVTTNDDQSKIATGRSYQDVAQQVAGVSGGGNPNIRGSSSLKNRYLIDGLDVTDPVTNTFSANLNFDSLSSFEILTGGMEAQYNSMGGVINVVTATGGDEFHVDASVYGNHYKLSAPAQFGSFPNEGATLYSDTVRPPTQSLQGNVNFSGPIIKQKLWFNLSLQYDDSQTSQPVLAPLFAQGPNRRFNSILGRAKITYAPSAKHRITLSASGDPANISFQQFGGAAAGTTAISAGTRQNQGGGMGTVIWDYFINDAWTLKTQVGTQYQFLDVGPEGYFADLPTDVQTNLSDAARTWTFDRPRHVNVNDNTAWYNVGALNADRRNRLQLDTSLSHRFEAAGRHEAQVGLQMAALQHRQYVNYTGGGFSYTDQNPAGTVGEAGLCDEANGQFAGCYQRSFNEDFQIRNRGASAGIYLQDRYKPTTWLTILPGIRFDYGTSRDNANRVVSQLFGVGPRLGAALDVTRDQKTIVSAYYGRANEVLSLLSAANASETPGGYVEVWNRGTNSWDFAQNTGGPGSIALDPRTTAPHSDQIELAVRREVVPGAAATLQYTWKRVSNIWDTVEYNTILDPTGTRVIGYADGDPRQKYLLTTPNGNWNQYHGVDVILEARPSAPWYFYGAYTLAFKTGPSVDEMGQLGVGGRYLNFRQDHLYTGYTFGDIRHQLKFNGSYTIKNFTVGPNIAFETGSPSARTSNVYDPNHPVGTVLRSPPGTQSARGDSPGTNPNNIRGVTEFRTPNFLQFNLRAQYNFQELTKQNLALIADVFNVLNLSQPTGYRGNVVAGNTFGLLSGRQQPLRVQLGLRYMY